MFVPALAWGIGIGVVLLVAACSGEDDPPFVPPKEHALKVRENHIVNSQEETVYLRGVALGNNVWDADAAGVQNPRISDAALLEQDFSLIANLGMNVVRYALTYKWLENDERPFAYREEGFRDLDQRLAWAKNNGIYVILDIHNSPGGWQSEGRGDALWSNRNNQLRLIALWQEIARRYKDDPTVVGYDLLNEPHPPADATWQAFAQEIANAIREVDPDKILVVCNTLVTWDDDWSRFPFAPFLIEDDNVLYTAHFYEPADFTHQGAFWTPIPQGAYYPDEVVDFTNEKFQYVGGYYENPGVDQATDWQYLEGNWVDFSAIAPEANLGQAFFKSGNERGMVWIDEVVVEERNPAGEIRNVPLRNGDFSLPLVMDLLPAEIDLYPQAYFPPFWQLADLDVDTAYPQLIDPEAVKLDRTTGHNEQGALRFMGCAEGRAAASLLNNYFKIKPGYQYRVSGWVKGEGLGPLSGSEGNWNAFMINVFGDGFTGWDRNYLEEKIAYYADWAAFHNVPLFIGEFGVMDQASGDDLVWTEDVLQIMNSRDLHWTYWSLRGGVAGATFDLISGDYRRQGMIDLLSSYAREQSVRDAYK